ncbi:ribonuclease HII [Brevibacterium pityocampae]
MTAGTGRATAPVRRAARKPFAGLTDLSLERELLASGVRTLIGMDEVGRGCLAGPVGVGAVHFDLAALTAAEVPAGIHDSKQLSIPARARIAEVVAAWQPHRAVAYASPAEIDALGLSSALCLAGRRALAGLPGADLVLLDGSFDWLSLPLTFDALEHYGDAAGVVVPPVRTVVKGDGTHVTIAAASVLAKVGRDGLMAELAEQFPAYGWERNAGYPAPVHRAAIAEHGATVHHRRSFRLG